LSFSEISHINEADFERLLGLEPTLNNPENLPLRMKIKSEFIKRTAPAAPAAVSQA